MHLSAILNPPAASFHEDHYNVDAEEASANAAIA